jgi:hypothetical protein
MEPPTFVERRTVSRKTPGDGKLEITPDGRRKLAPLGDAFAVEWRGARGRATLHHLACTCRGPENPHEHWFVQSELLRQLPVGEEVELRADATERVLVVLPGA